MKPINVLLITNTPAEEAYLKDIIENYGKVGKTVSLRTGSEAIEYFAKSQTDDSCVEPDLIVCDIPLQSDDFFNFFNYFSIEQKAHVACMVPQDSMDNFVCGKFFCIERPFNKVKFDLLMNEVEYSLFCMH